MPPMSRSPFRQMFNRMRLRIQETRTIYGQDLASMPLGDTGKRVMIGRMIKNAEGVVVHRDDVPFAVYKTRKGIAEVPLYNQWPQVPWGRGYKSSLIKAELAPDVKCDARCVTASGTKCRCSCGGTNHARAAGGPPPDVGDSQ